MDDAVDMADIDPIPDESEEMYTPSGLPTNGPCQYLLADLALDTFDESIFDDDDYTYDPFTDFMITSAEFAKCTLPPKYIFTIGGWYDGANFGCGDFVRLVKIARDNIRSSGYECLPHATVAVRFMVFAPDIDNTIIETEKNAIVLRIYYGNYEGGELWDGEDMVIKTQPSRGNKISLVVFKGPHIQNPVVSGKMFMAQFRFIH